MTTAIPETHVNVTINGIAHSVPAGRSIILTLWEARQPLFKEASCLEGVCGACRIMVRYADSPEVKMALACQTNVEAGMQVIFSHFPEQPPHQYQLQQHRDGDAALTQLNDTFPQVNNCRHCHGCTIACPKGIDVEAGVRLASSGKLAAAGELFVDCVMCDLCLTSCPEAIDPNYVALFARRTTAFNNALPTNLAQRLDALRRGELKISY